MGFKEWLRDQSYLFAKVASLLEFYEDLDQDFDIARTTQHYQALIKHLIQQFEGTGVSLLLTYHGLEKPKNAKHRQLIQEALHSVCQTGRIHCLDVDKVFNVPDASQYFLADGHWNAKGHERFGKTLSDALLAQNTQ